MYKLKHKIIFLILLVMLPLLYFAIKDFLYLPQCWFYKIFSIPCPGCGIRRSLDFLFKFQIVGSVVAYPPIIGLSAVYLCFIIKLCIDIVCKNCTFYLNKIIFYCFFVTVVILFANWIIQIII